MPLVYFVDSSLNPVTGGNAFGELAKVDLALSFHAKWQYLTNTEKEDKIIQATSQIDGLDFKGSLVDPTQPLQFPRVMTDEATGDFTVAEQVRRLFRALVQQIEYNLNRVGIGMTQYSHGNESFTPRQDILCREALQSLMLYVRK